MQLTATNSSSRLYSAINLSRLHKEIKYVFNTYEVLVEQCRKKFGSTVAEQQCKRKKKRNEQKELKRKAKKGKKGQKNKYVYQLAMRKNQTKR